MPKGAAGLGTPGFQYTAYAQARNLFSTALCSLNEKRGASRCWPPRPSFKFQRAFLFGDMDLLFSDFKSGKRRVSEANIQAELYLLCRNNGISILLEVTFESCRFDALIFHENKAVAIVEIKSYGRARMKKDPINGGFFHGNKRQKVKYLKHGLPLFVIPSKERIFPVFEEIVNFIHNYAKH